jgi:hypothetical protein
MDPRLSDPGFVGVGKRLYFYGYATMNFKTHAPARREGTTLQSNIHSVGNSLARWSPGKVSGENPLFGPAQARNKPLAVKI